MTKLRTIVDRHATAFGGNAGLAHAIGMTNSGLLRGLKAGRLSVESLIRLAFVTKENADEVLRLGGRSDMADLLRALFGPSQAPTGLNPSVVEDRWRELERTVARVKMELLAQLVAPPPHRMTHAPREAEPKTAARGARR